MMIKKARRQGGGMAALTMEENIDIMIHAMWDLNLHLQASAGYKYTGTMCALDGSEDEGIHREANMFWDELSLRQKINAAIAEVEATFHAGLLPWNDATVQALITPYPRRGKLDSLKIGQEDEATPDLEGVL